MDASKTTQEQKFLTLQESADFLRISVRTLNRAIKAGRVKAHKISDNRTIIHRKALYAFAIFGKPRLTPSEHKELETYLSE